MTQPPPARQPDQPDQPDRPDQPDGPDRPDGPGEEPAPDAPPEAATGPTPEASTEPTPEASTGPLPDQPGAAAPPPPPVPPAPPAGSRRALKVTVGVVGALAVGVVAVVAGALLFSAIGGDEQPRPEVGDCLTDAVNADDIEVVDCGSAEAAWTVIGLSATLTEREFGDASRGDLCQEFPGWTGPALWFGEETDDLSGEGEVVCLAAVGAQPGPRR